MSRLDDRLKGNLLEPLTWPTYGECDNFIKNHRCHCEAFLNVKEIDGEFVAACPLHGPVIEHGYIHRVTAERMEANRHRGRVQMLLAGRKRRSPKQIISELYGGRNV